MNDKKRNTEWDGATYDNISDPQANWGAVVMQRLDLSGDECVMDAGCGSGRVTEQLLQRVPRGKVIAVDQSISMLDVAKSRLARFGDQVSFVQADLLSLSPEHLGSDSPVDAIFSNATFHWVTDHDRLFHNLRSVLRDGGQLVAQCGGRGNLDALLETVRRLGQERAGTWEYASAEQTRRRLARAGFVDVETWTHEEPTKFDSRGALEVFLATVCLREHLEQLTADDREPFIAAVADAVPDATIDYVRLNIVARKGPLPD